MRFEVLGPLRVEHSGEPLPLTSGRQRALLANLLLAGGASVPADQLIEAVWGDELPTNPANTLQHGIAQLRKLLEPDRTRSDPPRVLVSDGSGYRLELEGHTLDAAEFETRVGDGRRLLEQGNSEAAAESLRGALAMWRGPAYADFAYSDFAQAEADRLNEMKVQAREVLIDAESAASGPETVVADLDALVVEYPYREGLWARLMTALYQSGRQAEALRTYQKASKVLGDELGIEPSAELRQLEERILLQDPSLAAPASGPPRHNLPTPATPLVGRREALAQVTDFVRNGRLTSLLGPGGSGKTRLAIEVATDVVTEFADGVWLVRLDDLADPDLLVPTIGVVTGMPEDASAEVIETLIGFLRDKRVLLVLDNCEHLVEPVAALVETLLAECPTLTILTTSQVALKVGGEQRVPIPPLRLPGEEASPFDDLESVPSVQLFLERAAAVDPDVDRSLPAIAAIANVVRALDGIPLAIELAAARADVLTPVEIARRLSDRFEILDGGPRDVPARQRTLRAAVDWSFGLLDEDEKRFFSRLGVFSGSFDVSAAAAVTETTESGALSMIGRLVQRSLLIRDASGPDRSRYRLLETLRLFGVEQLRDSADLDRIKDIHLGYCAGLVDDLDNKIIGADQLAAFSQLVCEQDNLRAAMAWSLETGRLESGVAIAARSGRFWDWRGSLAEAATWTTRFLDAAPDPSTSPVALLMSWGSYFAWELGNEDRAAQLSAESARLGAANDDDLGHAAGLTGLALQARVGGDPVKAIGVNNDVRLIAERIGNRWLAAWADNHDGLAMLAAGDLEGAHGAAEASLEGFSDLGDRRATGWALTVLAQIALERGDASQTVELAERAILVSKEAGDGRNSAWALELAGEASRSVGDEAAADRYATEAAHVLDERGMPRSPWRRPAEEPAQ